MKLPHILTYSLLFPFFLQAETLVGFIPQGFSKGGPSPWTPEVQPGEIELAKGVRIEGGLVRGSGILAGGTADAWGGNGFDGQSKEEALSKQSWFSVTLAPEEGHTLSLQNIQATIFRAKESASTYLWQYRLGDGEFVDLGEPVIIDQNSARGIAQSPIALTSVPTLQNISQPVTLRMLGWGASKSSSSWGFGKTTGQPTLSIEGTVVAKP